MPIRKTVFVRGGLYHLVNRGALKTGIFAGDIFYNAFLVLLRVYAAKYEVSIVAFCIMPNHFHLVVRQCGEMPISAFMRDMQRKFARLYNIGNNKSGAVFEGRFWSEFVDNDEYSLTLLAYVHLNPVKAKLCKLPSDWPHSNYNAFIGTKTDSITDIDCVKAVVPDMPLYLAFIDDCRTRLT